MKLRYYLRGLGIGIVVTTIITGITAKPEELTDAQIKIRAAQLGMVEQNVLSDLNKSEEVSSTEENSPDESEPEGTEQEELSTQAASEEEVQENLSEEEKEEEKHVTVVSSQKDKSENTSEKTENYIIITVESGYGSHTVSEKLYEAGLVNSAEDYDHYLMENGYERKLRTGHHEIPVGASHEEIAKILCKIN